MRARTLAGLVVAICLLMPAAARAAGNAGAFVLSATSTSGASHYAPTFTGNGLLGIRVPAAGQGYAGGTVPAQAELAGFYAKPSMGKVSDLVQQRANIPTWSTLSFADGGVTFAPFRRGRTSSWRQSIDLHTGVITTTARWRAPDGHVSDLTYRVFTDRAAPHVGVVTLTLTPRYTGLATVTDLIDGTADRVTGPMLPPVLTRQAAKASDPAARLQTVTVTALGTGVTAAVADRLVVGSNIAAPSVPVDQSVSQSLGQRVAFPVTAGRTYVLTKYVGVEDSQTSSDPAASAQLDASTAALRGAATLLAANDAAWAAMWRGRIDVAGDRTVATDVNASQFYLWSSTRADEDWSVSPAGLSSNGYDGHIFWDAETWMFPSLLAQHPDLAVAMETYRFDRLAAAQRHARATGFAGARFPWESALDGTEQIPPPVSVNSEGLYEQHITADIAQANWQYYLATGDRQWLATRGWPVISQGAVFWASRAVRGRDGQYHVYHVTGPDEENPNVTDEAFTLAGARATLRDAIAAARVLGVRAPARWSRVSAGLTLHTDRFGVVPEYAGYHSQLVKQADVTLLPYLWRAPLSPRVQRADLNFYVPRTDPGGPSMSDAVNSIDTSALRTPGCASFVDTRRSYEPFIRDPFHQFSETRTGGAFTFMTGIGGFLQEFLYGYSGLRFDAGGVRIAPTMNAQLRAITLRDLSWHGRTFTVAIGPRVSTVTLRSGAPLPVNTRAGRRTVRAGHPLRVVTARPDLDPTSDAVRCVAARASSAEPGAPALAAVDGSAATQWQPTALPATLTAPIHGARTIRRATITWGHVWPTPPKANVHPAPGPVKTLRATGYALQFSRDGRHWRTLITVRSHSPAGVDRLSFPPTLARYVRLRMTRGVTMVTVTAGTTTTVEKLAPMVQELTVS
ncbi:MAG: discoidin domain-containing protein [Solirubrobacterales bacterium]|nr:discoidin domain-containing protein [Solirubrobacterales bacterium]